MLGCRPNHFDHCYEPGDHKPVFMVFFIEEGSCCAHDGAPKYDYWYGIIWHFATSRYPQVTQEHHIMRVFNQENHA